MKTLLWLLAAVVLPATLAADTDPKTRPPAPTVAPEGTVAAPMGRTRISSHAEVGEAAPGFELISAGDARVKLSDYRGGRVLLAFADRREACGQLGALAESLRADGVRLVGICRASPRSLRAIVERDSLRFDLLSDITGEIAALYGSYDFATSTIRPGYILVGRQGTVRMVVLGQALPPDELLQITRYVLAGL